MNISRLRYHARWAILLVIPALLLSSACLNSPQPPPEPAPPVNNSPIINSLNAENEVPTSSETKITCNATDADGDILTYHWSADGGTIKGEGSSITWVAPDTAGNHNIKVTITDGKGGTATESTAIAVIEKPNQPPTIVSLTIDGNPLEEEEYRLREWITVTLQCNAEDPDGDELAYLWRRTGGKLSGEEKENQIVGNPVGWTSPGVPGDFTVTVTVTDGRGGKAEASIPFKVLCCGRTT